MKESAYVYVCVCQSLLNGDGLSLPDMVADKIGPFVLEDRAELLVPNIHLIEARARIQRRLRSSICKTIYNQHIMPCVQVGSRQRCSNKACSPCNRYFHISASL